MMGHHCCSKQRVKRGLWSPEEDEKLIKHITSHGHGSWSSVPKLAGLQRCGKSCRLRWINYLRPGVKRGSFSAQEERTIIDVHRMLGNRWAQIAKHLPGRTDNEVKNYWNSCIKKKLIAQGLDPNTHNLLRTPPNYNKRLNSNIKSIDYKSMSTASSGSLFFPASHHHLGSTTTSIHGNLSVYTRVDIDHHTNFIDMKAPLPTLLPFSSHANSTTHPACEYQHVHNLEQQPAEALMEVLNLGQSSSSCIEITSDQFSSNSPLSQLYANYYISQEKRPAVGGFEPICDKGNELAAAQEGRALQGKGGEQGQNMEEGVCFETISTSSLDFELVGLSENLPCGMYHNVNPMDDQIFAWDY